VLAISVAIVLWFCSSVARAEGVEVLRLGHSTFRITSTTGKVIAIDPFIKRNSRTPPEYKDLAKML
jgi:L-ascorbate metabolism protein UlaG (beta-lactamase superfamily)